ncbi:hypothetical protein Pcar_3367 [Syntrophotalea carbinolica DSM 2380]|uniref:Secreted protein n=1 Tax=Syntrophotalea carbinolica (strain DSM 2380 / NBRC 103641 / GraBd1) TaxID=338963 RepID=Q0C6F6_SYNC1|nr:hypothetical protein Pcar_3367 [Syntrophotalea carbinolica DSM 2380]
MKYLLTLVFLRIMLLATTGTSASSFDDSTMGRAWPMAEVFWPCIAGIISDSRFSFVRVGSGVSFQ